MIKLLSRLIVKSLLSVLDTVSNAAVENPKVSDEVASDLINAWCYLYDASLKLDGKEVYFPGVPNVGDPTEQSY